MNIKHKQSGGIVILLLAGVAVLVLIALLGSTLLTSLMGGGQRSSMNISTGQILSQVAYTLVTETNTSGSIPIPSVPAAWGTGIFPAAAPVIGTANAVGEITATSKAPKVDAWGSYIGYCTYASAAQGDPVFAVISAGPDRIFQTSCTQAFAGTPQGDDQVRFKTVTNVEQGVGGTIYYKDPVANEAGLSNITQPAVGEVRYVIADQATWTNPSGAAGAAGVTWFPSQGLVTAVTAGATCTFPAGTMGKDALGNLYVCQ